MVLPFSVDVLLSEFAALVLTVLVMSVLVWVMVLVLDPVDDTV
jgi:hypothetical protein